MLHLSSFLSLELFLTSLSSLNASKPDREALPLGRSPRLEVPVCYWWMLLNPWLWEGAVGWRCQSGVGGLLLNPWVWEGVLNAQKVIGVLSWVRMRLVWLGPDQLQMGLGICIEGTVPWWYWKTPGTNVTATGMAQSSPYSGPTCLSKPHLTR